MTQDPYAPLSQQSGSSQSPHSRRRVAGAAVAVIAAIVVAGSGIANQRISLDHPFPDGTRYATYDPEFFFLGIPASPETARWISFTVVPILIALAIVLLRPLVRKARMPESQDGG
ncbi:hypothetical protein [Rubripirellula reticaptiva]|uniref:hypothetical protein n=1 Tax=Rubripirellula reticaptiva TaxID=2528013 RepID=UPI001C94C312|nr:hypothetical protein [Rubripirellula reticaptiva]